VSEQHLFAETEPYASSPPGCREPSSARGTILLVEDETFVRDVTCEILQCEGYHVLKARDSSEAKALFGQFHGELQLLLTDVVLPGQNGRDLALQLKADCPALRTILISGYPSSFTTKDGHIEQEGAFYIPKPFSAELLLRKVHEVICGGGELGV